MSVAKSERFGNDAVLVGSRWTCACLEKDAHDLDMAVGSGKVERSGAFSTWAAAGTFGFESRCVDVGAVKDEHAHALFAATRACSMQRQDAVEVAVGRLTILEGELDETDVACGGGIMQTQVWMHPVAMMRGAARGGLDERSATDGTAQHGGGVAAGGSRSVPLHEKNVQERLAVQAARRWLCMLAIDAYDGGRGILSTMSSSRGSKVGLRQDRRG